MHPFSSEEVLKAWESGRDQHPIDRAITILSLALPEESFGELAMLTIGKRDSLLLAQRVMTFGPDIAILIKCPSCGERLEMTINADDISVAEGKFDGLATSGRAEVSFRLPNSLDLAAAIASPDISSARRLIIERCIVDARVDGAPVSIDHLPEDLISKIVDGMAEGDPQADILLDVECPNCGRAWQALFDIILILWREISAEARRIFMDVHTLAKAYGWSERDILAMSPTRRQSYLEMVGS